MFKAHMIIASYREFIQKSQSQMAKTADGYKIMPTAPVSQWKDKLRRIEK